MISPSQRPLPDNTQHSQQTNIHAQGGIRTHNLSRRAAKDLRPRPRGHWDRQRSLIVVENLKQRLSFGGQKATQDYSNSARRCGNKLSGQTSLVSLLDVLKGQIIYMKRRIDKNGLKVKAWKEVIMLFKRKIFVKWRSVVCGWMDEDNPATGESQRIVTCLDTQM